MATTPLNIDTLLRQRALLNQITGQGTNAAMEQPGISQFNTPSTGTASGQPQRTSPGILAGAALGAAATGGNVADAVKQRAQSTPMGQVFQGAMNKINPPTPTAPQTPQASQYPQLQMNPDGSITMGQQPKPIPMNMTGQYSPGNF